MCRHLEEWCSPFYLDLAHRLAVKYLEERCSPFYLDLTCPLAAISVTPESMNSGNARLIWAHFQSTLVSILSPFGPWLLFLSLGSGGRSSFMSEQPRWQSLWSCCPKPSGVCDWLPPLPGGSQHWGPPLVCYPVMVGTRRSLWVRNCPSLQNWVHQRLGRGVLPADIVREFLSDSGDGHTLSLGEMALKGYALLDLPDSFFLRVH